MNNFFNPGSASKCEKIIKLVINTKTDTNTSPVRNLNFYADVFFPVIANLTNECSIKGVFPESLKFASITPIFKKLISNYRPKCSLLYLSKITEKLMHSRLIT